MTPHQASTGLRTLILGVGNDWASDDGAGPAVVRRVQKWWNARLRDAKREVGFQVLARPDLSLLDLMARYDEVIIVDAVVSGAAPGTLHRQVWEKGMLGDKGVARASSHGFGLRELLQMAASLGKLPTRVELWGVAIASTEPGQGLTPQVARAVDDFAAELLTRLQDCEVAV